MSIRAQLISAISLCLLVAFGGISFLVFSTARREADEAFRAMATVQAARVGEWVSSFISPGEMNARYLSNLALVRNSRGRLSSYLDSAETSTLWYANHTPYERRVYDEFIRISRSNENYGLVFMANDDGQYAQAPEGHIKPAGYDPRQRSWYLEAMSNPQEVTVSSPYLTTGGGMVCSIMVKTYDNQGNPLGVLGVDYSLDLLTRDMAARRVMKPGYLVIFAHNWRLIVDGRNREYLYLPPEQYPTMHKRMAAAPDGFMQDTDARGLEKLIVTHTIARVGWKVAVVLDMN